MARSPPGADGDEPQQERVARMCFQKGGRRVFMDEGTEQVRGIFATAEPFGSWFGAVIDFRKGGVWVVRCRAVWLRVWGGIVYEQCKFAETGSVCAVNDCLRAGWKRFSRILVVERGTGLFDQERAERAGAFRAGCAGTVKGERTGAFGEECARAFREKSVRRLRRIKKVVVKKYGAWF